jgi:hypothetical protein
MDGKDKLSKEMHARYRRDGIKEVKVAAESFLID